MTPYDPDPLDIVEWHRGAQDRRRSLRPIHALLAGLLGVALGFLVARATLAASRSPVDVIPAGGTHDVEPDLQRATEAPTPRGAVQTGFVVPGGQPVSTRRSPGLLPQPPLILDPAPSRTPVPRASVDQPAAAPLTVGKATPRPAGGVTGTASWYCGAGSACTSGYPDGLYAAAGPALRVGDWRGRTVTVCASACVAVTLIDWCQCYGERVIDLYRSAFSRLASPSAGTVRVTVSW